MTPEAWNALSVIAAALFGALASILVAKIQNGSKTEESKPSAPEDKTHPLFAKIQLLKREVVLSLEMEDPGRTLIARDVLLHQFEAVEGAFRWVADQHDARQKICENDCSACQALYNDVVGALDQILSRCATYYKNTNYTLEEQTALDMVWAQFNMIHAPNLHTLLTHLERTTNSKFYRDCKVQSAMVYDEVTAILGRVVTDAEETFQLINGGLTGFTFRGVVVDAEKIRTTREASV